MFKEREKKSQASGRKGKALRKFRQEFPLYLLALPGVIALLLFSYFPILSLYLRTITFGEEYSEVHGPIRFIKISVFSLIICLQQ